MNDPSEFFEQIPAADAEAAVSHPGDLRSAIHAIMTLDGFFGILHARLYELQIVQEHDDSKWKGELAHENNYYRLLRDCVYALKHGELQQPKPRLVRRPDQIPLKGGVFQANVFQANAFQIDRIWIETDEDGDYRADVVIKNVAEFAGRSLKMLCR
jgi:hypothetical protein